MFENELDFLIYQHLVNNPGHVYINLFGDKLYALADDTMLIFQGYFIGMTDEEINLYIQRTCTAPQN